MTDSKMAFFQNGRFSKSPILKMHFLTVFELLSDSLFQFFCFIPIKISPNLYGRMDGSKFWCFPWFPENSLLCVILRYTVYKWVAISWSAFTFESKSKPFIELKQLQKSVGFNWGFSVRPLSLFWSNVINELGWKKWYF